MNWSKDGCHVKSRIMGRSYWKDGSKSSGCSTSRDKYSLGESSTKGIWDNERKSEKKLIFQGNEESSRKTLKESIEDRLAKAWRAGLGNYYDIRKRKGNLSDSLSSLAERKASIIKPNLSSGAANDIKKTAKVFFKKKPDFKFSSHFTLQTRSPSEADKPIKCKNNIAFQPEKLGLNASFLKTLRTAKKPVLRALKSIRPITTNVSFKQSFTSRSSKVQTARHTAADIPQYIETKDRVMKMTVAVSKKDKSRQKPSLFLKAIRKLNTSLQPLKKDSTIDFYGITTAIRMNRHLPSYHTPSITNDLPSLSLEVMPKPPGLEIANAIGHTAYLKMASSGFPGQIDIPCNFYALRYSPKPSWRRSRAKQRQIQACIDRTALHDINTN